MSLFDHLGVVVSRLSIAEAFYTPCLAEIGVTLLQDNSISDTEGWLVYGTDQTSAFFVVSAGKPSFWTAEHAPGRSPVHIAFAAPSESSVRGFYEAGLANGGRGNGEPGDRRSSTPYYAAYLIDPDRNNIEAGYRGDC